MRIQQNSFALVVRFILFSYIKNYLVGGSGSLSYATSF